MLGSFPALVRSDTVVDTAEEVKDALLPEKPKVKTGGVRLQRSSSSHLTLILRRVSMQWRITLQPTRLALQFGQLTPGKKERTQGGLTRTSARVHQRIQLNGCQELKLCSCMLANPS